MEDVVAIEVTLENGEHRYFMTWGRIQDNVESAPLEELVMLQSGRVELGGVAKSARLCSTLSEAQSALYFFEGLLTFAQSMIPFGDGYADWRDGRREQMAEGREIYYLGPG
jgi:hypothetical protein